MERTRRSFVASAVCCGAWMTAAMSAARTRAEVGMALGEPMHGRPGDAAFDSERMRALAEYASSFLSTAPNPFGCEIVDSKTGELLMRAMNAVSAEHDPSAHAEVRTMRLACAKLGTPSLAGYTLYTTCEPCPMCMSCALWAGVDRVVYGATIADANRFCMQIQVPATEVAKRSDMACVVVGPVEREACVAIFEDHRMQAAFSTWTSRKRQ